MRPQQLWWHWKKKNRNIIKKQNLSLFYIFKFISFTMFIETRPKHFWGGIASPWYPFPTSPGRATTVATGVMFIRARWCGYVTTKTDFGWMTCRAQDRLPTSKKSLNLTGSGSWQRNPSPMIWRIKNRSEIVQSI